MIDDNIEELEDLVLEDFYNRHKNKLSELRKQYTDPKERNKIARDFEEALFKESSGDLLLDYYIRNERNVNFTDFDAKLACYFERRNIAEKIEELRGKGIEGFPDKIVKGDFLDIQREIDNCEGKMSDLKYSNETNIGIKRIYLDTKLHFLRKLLRKTADSPNKTTLIEDIFTYRGINNFMHAEQRMVGVGDVVDMEWRKGGNSKIKELLRYYFFLENMNFFKDTERIKQRLKFLGDRYHIDPQKLENNKKQYNELSKDKITNADLKKLYADFIYLELDKLD